MFLIGFETIAEHSEPAVLEGIDTDCCCSHVWHMGKDNSLVFWCRLYIYLQALF